MARPEFWNHGLQFACTRCSHCCRHESGYVFLSEEDLGRLARHRGISREECIDRYCRWVPFGTIEHLSLREHANRDCVFWVDGGCSVYESRPVQCRTYPFWSTIVDTPEHWNREAFECPGIGIGGRCFAPEIDELLARRRRYTPMTRTRGER